MRTERLTKPRFCSLVLDVDSTLCGVEGVDWLAQLRGGQIAKQSAQLTERAMDGEIPIEAVYGERLALIRPSREEMDALAKVYRDRIASDAPAAVHELRSAGVRIVLVSGGFRRAIAPLARELDVELRAVDVYWDDAGNYLGFDVASPLATQSGKLEIVRALALSHPVLAMGDGSTDAGMRPAVDEFAAYTGFVRRDTVVAVADHVIATYQQLVELVL